MSSYLGIDVNINIIDSIGINQTCKKYSATGINGEWYKSYDVKYGWKLSKEDLSFFDILKSKRNDECLIGFFGFRCGSRIELLLTLFDFCKDISKFVKGIICVGFVDDDGISGLFILDGKGGSNFEIFSHINKQPKKNLKNRSHKFFNLLFSSLVKKPKHKSISFDINHFRNGDLNFIGYYPMINRKNEIDLDSYKFFINNVPIDSINFMIGCCFYQVNHCNQHTEITSYKINNKRIFICKIINNLSRRVKYFHIELEFEIINNLFIYIYSDLIYITQDMFKH